MVSATLLASRKFSLWLGRATWQTALRSYWSASPALRGICCARREKTKNSSSFCRPRWGVCCRPLWFTTRDKSVAADALHLSGGADIGPISGWYHVVWTRHDGDWVSKWAHSLTLLLWGWFLCSELIGADVRVYLQRLCAADETSSVVQVSLTSFSLCPPSLQLLSCEQKFTFSFSLSSLPASSRHVVFSYWGHAHQIGRCHSNCTIKRLR